MHRLESRKLCELDLERSLYVPHKAQRLKLTNQLEAWHLGALGSAPEDVT